MICAFLDQMDVYHMVVLVTIVGLCKIDVSGSLFQDRFPYFYKTKKLDVFEGSRQ